MRKNTLNIASGVSLPANLSTQSITVLAKRRVGKSYTMRRIWEQLLKTEQQAVVVDPKGDQWGIRSSSDGKKPGFPVLILGGEHGDLPLEKESGELIAKLVVEQQVNVLLDTSHFSKTARAQFMAAFLENLYRLKAQEKYRTPLCVIIDEADEIAPQRPQKGEERMLGAVDDIVRRGGQRGLGSVLITQRSASLNKNVLTQSEMLILLRTIAPQDLAAVKAWIDVHGTDEQRKIIMAELPSLPIGDAYFWAPAWPSSEGMFKRAHVLPIETFDSAKTPEVGERRVIPKNLADVDLDALKGQMSATIEKAKSEDPKLLKKRIGDLERENVSLKTGQKPAVPVSHVKERRIEIPVLKDSQITRLENIFDKMNKEAARHEAVIAPLRKDFQECAAAVVKAVDTIRDAAKNPSPVTPVARVTSPVIPVEKKASTPTIDFQGTPGVVSENLVTPSEQRILNSIAWLSSNKIENPSRILVALCANYRPNTGNYTNLVGGLRTKGLIEYPTPGKMVLTTEGAAMADGSGPGVYNSVHLHNYILEKTCLSTPEKKILRPVLDNGQIEMSRAQVAEASNYIEKTGNFTNLVGGIRSMGLIDYPNPGMIQAAPFFFV